MEGSTLNGCFAEQAIRFTSFAAAPQLLLKAVTASRNFLPLVGEGNLTVIADVIEASSELDDFLKASPTCR